MNYEHIMYETVCLRCENHAFCENYGDETCEALDVLNFLLKNGRVTLEDIRKYREELIESFKGA